MKLAISVFALLTTAQLTLGAPLVKSGILAVGADGLIQNKAYHVASVGASFAVEHTGLFGPLLNKVPAAKAILSAAKLFGSKFAGKTAGGLASTAVGGIIKGEQGNDTPFVGWIIRDQDNNEQIVLDELTE